MAPGSSPFLAPPRRGVDASPAPIPVGVALASDLWNQLLVQALNLQGGLRASVGVAEALGGLGPGGVAVLVTAVPAARSGWEKLAAWCRRGEAVRVLVLGENRPALAARALRLGAAGYLDWESPLAAVAKAIRGVHAGEVWAERKVTWTLLRGEAAARSRLTPCEQRALGLLAEGKRNKEIADLLSVGEATVKSHLNRAYRKLNLSDRLQAALYVERHGLE